MGAWIDAHVRTHEKILHYSQRTYVIFTQGGQQTRLWLPTDDTCSRYTRKLGPAQHRLSRCAVCCFVLQWAQGK